MNNLHQEKRRFRDYGLNVGEIPPAKKNFISDVPGVSVGHKTLIKGEGKLKVGKGPIRTGITIILLHTKNIFKHKVRAASFIMNGFGKTTGLPQLNELGTIETPIAITNTLNVGKVWDAIIDWMIKNNKQIGITQGSVSPLVTECNDGYLNDIQGRHVSKRDVFSALKQAQKTTIFEEGNIGAGTGMRVFGLKSGIGSSSRELIFDNNKYTVGILVVPNFGRLKDLRILGKPIGKIILNEKILPQKTNETSKGSIICIIATDIPLTHRQLQRVTKRAVIGIGRTGSYIGNGSGDFIIAFSTKNNISNTNEKVIEKGLMLLNEGKILNKIFRATIEATEEAIYNAMFQATTLKGRDNNILYALPVEEILPFLQKQ
ncbi:MAG: P1 family peptidase [Asgard group archaeon]|nr:P1 family peptidase [Asgard group archaeon]